MEKTIFYLVSILILLYPLSVKYFTEVFAEHRGKFFGVILLCINLCGFFTVSIYSIDLANDHFLSILGYGITFNLIILIATGLSLEKITKDPKYSKLYLEFLTAVNLLGLLTLIAFLIFLITKVNNLSYGYGRKFELFIILVLSITANVTYLIYAKKHPRS